MARKRYKRTPDDADQIAEGNFKVTRALGLPVFEGDPDLNENINEPGYIGMNDEGKVVAYDGDAWKTQASEEYVDNIAAEKADLVAGKVPAGQLPGYVDDVIEAANYAALPATGETGKIYVTLDSNWQYRWSGSVYIRIVASPGTTDEVPEGSTNKYFTAARVAVTAELKANKNQNNGYLGLNASGQADLNAKKIINVADAVSNQDAATLKQVNDLISASTQGSLTGAQLFMFKNFV